MVLRPKPWISLWLLTAMAFSLAGAAVPAAPPIAEIRTLLIQRALNPPALASLAALEPDNLEAGLTAIDPYARYVPPNAPNYKALSRRLGIDIFAYKSRLWVRPDPGGPAEQGGVPEIGELQAINNNKVSGDNLAEVSTLLDLSVQQDRVYLTVSSRAGKRGEIYLVKPGRYRPSPVTWRRAGDKMIIHIREFVAHNTAPNLAALYHTLVRPNSLVVIDLRGCAGGDLFEAIEIAGMFVPAGLPLANTYDRFGARQRYLAPPGKKLPGPIWLLIDRRTASAAEIFAGILKHHHLAGLIGERSVGKYLSQTPAHLSNGGELWLTNLAIHFPGGLTYLGTGLEPDIPIPDIMVIKADDIIAKLADETWKRPKKKNRQK